MTQFIEPNKKSDLKQETVRDWLQSLRNGVLNGFVISKSSPLNNFDVDITSGTIVTGGSVIYDDETRNDNTILSTALSGPLGADTHVMVYAQYTPADTFPAPPMTLEVAVATGSPPVPPALPADSVKLADIFVPSGATDLTNADIIIAPRVPAGGADDADVLIERVVYSNANIIVTGGGAFTYDSGTDILSWDADLVIYAPTVTHKELYKSAPVAKATVAAGSVGSMGDNAIAFIVFNRTSTSPSTPVMQVLDLDNPTAGSMNAFFDAAARDRIVFVAMTSGGTLIRRAGFGNVYATDVVYDNATSGLAATDVQAAIDELDATFDNLASASYPGTNLVGTAGLPAKITLPALGAPFTNTLSGLLSIMWTNLDIPITDLFTEFSDLANSATPGTSMVGSAAIPAGTMLPGVASPTADSLDTLLPQMYADVDAELVTLDGTIADNLAVFENYASYKYGITGGLNPSINGLSIDLITGSLIDGAGHAVATSGTTSVDLTAATDSRRYIIYWNHTSQQFTYADQSTGLTSIKDVPIALVTKSGTLGSLEDIRSISNSEFNRSELTVGSISPVGEGANFSYLRQALLWLSCFATSVKKPLNITYLNDVTEVWQTGKTWVVNLNPVDDPYFTEASARLNGITLRGRTNDYGGAPLINFGATGEGPYLNFGGQVEGWEVHNLSFFYQGSIVGTLNSTALFHNSGPQFYVHDLHVNGWNRLFAFASWTGSASFNPDFGQTVSALDRAGTVFENVRVEYLASTSSDAISVAAHSSATLSGNLSVSNFTMHGITTRVLGINGPWSANPDVKINFSNCKFMDIDQGVLYMNYSSGTMEFPIAFEGCEFGQSTTAGYQTAWFPSSVPNSLPQFVNCSFTSTNGVELNQGIFTNCNTHDSGLIKFGDQVYLSNCDFGVGGTAATITSTTGCPAQASNCSFGLNAGKMVSTVPVQFVNCIFDLWNTTAAGNTFLDLTGNSVITGCVVNSKAAVPAATTSPLIVLQGAYDYVINGNIFDSASLLKSNAASTYPIVDVSGLTNNSSLSLCNNFVSWDNFYLINAVETGVDVGCDFDSSICNNHINTGSTHILIDRVGINGLIPHNHSICNNNTQASISVRAGGGTFSSPIHAAVVGNLIGGASPINAAYGLWFNNVDSSALGRGIVQGNASWGSGKAVSAAGNGATKFAGTTNTDVHNIGV